MVSSSLHNTSGTSTSSPASHEWESIRDQISQSRHAQTSLSATAGQKETLRREANEKKKNENPIGRSTPPDGPMRALTLGALWPCTCEERAFTWTHLASEAECTSTHSRVCVTSHHCHFLVFSSFLTYVSQFVKMGNVSGSANEMTCVFLFPILLEPLGVLSFNCFIHLLYLMS